MSRVDHDGLRLPLGEGQHIFACGATGSGKTTTMRRVLAARTLTQNAALLILDQKGDEEDVEQIPFLIDACHPLHYETLVEIAQRLGDRNRHLIRRVEEHAQYVSSRKGNGDLSGGAARLQVALALAGREIVTPRITPEGEAVGVGLVNALKARAVVMWRTHADVMPDEAAAMTVLALADLHDAAGQAGVPWTLMLDEFGAVIKMAASRAVAILQRGRSHGGQVIVVTQSVADPEALSGQPGLLPSLTDNFSGVVAHRQTAPESRDWLAKLMGTRALWQSTNQTTGHGSNHSGRGSARRVREFRIGSDTFAELSQGETIIYTTLGPDPRRATISPVRFDDRQPERIGTGGHHPCELSVHPEERLPAAAGSAPEGEGPMGPDPHSARF
jgi:hypothetical protein